ncbi:MAG: OmpA family protein [Sneathiellaceae bacterium]
MVARFAAGARAARSLAFVALLAPALGACAYGVGDLFGDAPPPPPPPPVFVPKGQAGTTASGGSTAADAAAQEQQESFPTLGQVPERPTPGTTNEEQQAAMQSLAADRRNAQYTQERLTGEMSDGGAPDPAPPAPQAATQTPAAATPTPTPTPAAAAAPPPTRTAPPPEPVAVAKTPVTSSSQMAAASAATTVPAPPSAGGSSGDESANVQRAIDSRDGLTEGTTRGSALQSRTEQPVLQRTERLTAALNSPAASTAEVEAFTRRMAERSPASQANYPSPSGQATAPSGRAMAGSGAVSQTASSSRSTTTGVPASRLADELLAARAGQELAAYEEQQDGMPEPKLTTTAVAAPAAASSTNDIEAATQRAIERQAEIDRRVAARDARSAEAGRSSESVTMAETVTPRGQVTMVETVTETVPVAAVAQRPPPPPQSLAEVYEAQLRASSASTLQQAAREGASLAAVEGGGIADARSLPASYPAPAYPAQAYPSQAYPQEAYPQQAAYGTGTVVVSGTGTSTMMPQPAGPAPGFSGAAAGQAGVKAGTIRFAVGSSRLGSEDLATLRRIAQQYRQFGGRVLVVGHASSRTADMPPDEHKMINFDISQERAQRVAAQLGQYGIPAAAILVEARADMDPIYFEAMPAAETANRRAEVFFLR